MVPDTAPTATVDSKRTASGSRRLVNALLGGGAGIILSFIPLSTLLGGAVAGYLEDGAPGDGLKVGAIAGFVMLVPFLFFGLAVASFFPFFRGGGAGGPVFAFGMMGLFVLIGSILYTVGASAVGGYLGVYVRNEL
ncbi:DUF5518 domain-containing protein [Natrinema salifodinae]|uniref:DUF5518 domain-containing protein n=1 Tax=Natrinema salifodinae TaxID=1202768 RepID=A0A1I0PS28_9EURY|nr:DUF5518 domain-containing protein [Natrinema salifodinae]SEW17165.1 hypothetical protein SAMN05216285_2874 [Natrinema salifodinae]